MEFPQLRRTEALHMPHKTENCKQQGQKETTAPIQRRQKQQAQRNPSSNHPGLHW